ESFHENGSAIERTIPVGIVKSQTAIFSLTLRSSERICERCDVPQASSVVQCKGTRTDDPGFLRSELDRKTLGYVHGCHRFVTGQSGMSDHVSGRQNNDILRM